MSRCISTATATACSSMPETGEVIAVEPPRRRDRRAARRGARCAGEIAVTATISTIPRTWRACAATRTAAITALRPCRPSRMTDADAPRDYAPRRIPCRAPRRQRSGRRCRAGRSCASRRPSSAEPLGEPQRRRAHGRSPTRTGQRLSAARVDTTGAVAEPIGSGRPPSHSGAREDVAALQVLLDRAGASPGVIDGKFGSNVDKAIAAYNADHRQQPEVDRYGRHQGGAGGDRRRCFRQLHDHAEDAAGPYRRLGAGRLRREGQARPLSYTSVTETLAERFHMDEDYLKALNPEADFNRPGTIIKVANIGKPVTTQVARIVADKAQEAGRAYDAGGKLVAAYPATIGSSDTPSPTGTHAVSRIALDPELHLQSRRSTSSRARTTRS